MFGFWFWVFLSVQAVLGLLLFKWAWGRMEKIREVDEERDQQFPCWRRVDAKNWVAWKFIPGAMIMMPTRLVSYFSLLFIHGIVVLLLQLGRDKEPLKKGFRKSLINYSFDFSGVLWLIIAGTIPFYTDVDADYTYYLGPDYKNKSTRTGQVSTVISNHQSYMDIPILYMKYRVNFAPGIFLKSNPIFNALCTSLDCIYMPRGGTDEAREKSV